MREKAAVQKQKAETRNKAMEALVNKTLQKQERQCCKKPSTIWNQQTTEEEVVAEAVSSILRSIHHLQSFEPMCHSPKVGLHLPILYLWWFCTVCR